MIEQYTTWLKKPLDTGTELHARTYAIHCHGTTCHYYADKYVYGLHLAHVRHIAEQFKHLIPQERQGDVFAACWCHDTIEDTRQTFNDVKVATNENVAEIVYAVTQPKGKNRAERNSKDYYLGIWNNQWALYVKMCDRIANVEFSKHEGGRMFEVYKKEHANFQHHLYNPHYGEMFKYLTGLFIE